MRTAKIFIIAAVLLLAGVVLFFIGFASIGFNFSRSDLEGSYTEKSFVSTKVVYQIDFDELNGDIEIKKSEDENVHISYYESNAEYYVIDESDSGTLTFRKEITKKWYEWFFQFGYHAKPIVIAVPDSVTDLDVRTSNGEITVSAVEAEHETLKTSNGNISVKNISAESLMIETSNGNVRLEDISVVKRIGVETSNGQIKLNGVFAAEDIGLHSSNGQITGTIKGKMSDYNITSKTSLGKNNLPNSSIGGQKTLNVKTSNGNIDIYFTE